MFERLRKKKKPEPEIIIHQYEFVPPFDFEGATKEEVVKYLKSLSRVQLLHFGDTTDFDEINTELDLWDLYYEVRDWHGVWPTDEDVRTAMNKLYWDKDSLYNKYKAGDMDFTKRLDGMQKKLDKIVTLLENAEFTLTGKEALKL